jgi:hypothetical protein
LVKQFDAGLIGVKPPTLAWSVFVGSLDFSSKNTRSQMMPLIDQPALCVSQKRIPGAITLSSEASREALTPSESRDTQRI